MSETSPSRGDDARRLRRPRDRVAELDFAALAEQGHKPSRLNPDAPAVLSVDNLKMYFPVKSSGVMRRTVGHVQAVDGISFEVPKGGSLGPGR